MRCPTAPQALVPAARSCGSQKSDDDGSPREVYTLGNSADLARLAGPAALASAYTNLAAVFASLGELSQCQALLRQSLALAPDCGRAMLLLLYCELCTGNVAGALMLLKQGVPMMAAQAGPGGAAGA